jgi:hypothetical protein
MYWWIVAIWLVFLGFAWLAIEILDRPREPMTRAV